MKQDSFDSIIERIHNNPNRIDLVGTIHYKQAQSMGSMERKARDGCREEVRDLCSKDREEEGSMAMRRCSELLAAKAQPPGALGTLEAWAKRLAKLQCRAIPKAERFAYICFCADHGVAIKHNCSAYPSSVTQKVATALASKRAAGAVVCESVGRIQHFRVVDVGMLKEAVGSDASDKVANGSRSMVDEVAMNSEECSKAMDTGRRAISALQGKDIHAVVLGEIGIGNTTSSSALLAAVTGRRCSQVCGSGSGLDHAGVERKVQLVETALKRHANIIHRAATSPLDILQALGGLEIAAIVGAMMQAHEDQIAVLVDGFIVTVAALMAALLEPKVADCLFLTTRSPENGHSVALAELMRLGVPKPALDMDMRLGEGSAAALCVPILATAANIVSDMITLEEALSLPEKEDKSTE